MRASVRLWQTELFVVVIVVAILILSVSLTQGLQSTLEKLAQDNQKRNAVAIASDLQAEFPLTVESLQRIRAKTREFHHTYGDSVWVYGIDGTVIDSIHDEKPADKTLEEARLEGLTSSRPAALVDFEPGGFATAAMVVLDRDERRAGSVVVSESVSESLAVLSSVQSRLWVAFWLSLSIAGLLGFGFSEFIGRRVRMMSKAASAIAVGDFDQRVPTGLVPDEVRELAESYNTMAQTLGETFTSLKEREREIAAVVESMAEGVLAFDSAGCLRVANPEALALLRIDDSEVRARPAAELISHPGVLQLLETGLQGERTSASTVIGTRTVLIHATPIGSEECAEGAVLLMSDVTEQRRLQDAQRRFIGNASHEMRTPIAAIKGSIELLLDGAADQPEIRDDFLRTMQLEVDRMGRLVSDMLTLAQLEAGNLSLRWDAHSVDTMFKEAAAAMRPLVDRAGVTIDVDVPDGDVMVSCDRDRIMQVLLGFIDNALKHSTRGDRLVLSTRVHRSKAVIEVRDVGTGIPAEVLDRVFDRFFRADESRAAPRGAGLGLSIAKEIVEAHGSAIEVESEMGVGTAFRFDLPLPTEHDVDGRTTVSGLNRT